MKKLLSLFSLLTIGGTAVPTTIAASPYQKEETKLEISKVNYSQKNNLEKLNRVKRQDNKKNNIVGISEIVIITNKSIISSGVVLNNKLYFGSFDHNVYEYNPKTEQQKVVITTNGSILSSGVALNNKLYFGSKDNKVYEYDTLQLIESKIINMRDQVKRGLYLYHKKQNPNSEIKQILNINLKI
ncbi:hypothetical protein [Spiroplasma endosymbiont of Seladonia tumulorum]|uniref:hypothetical protein n=1 Tax=Spiroplasma endosymbiont of Seladonia tumulorum TaxID=3066321 RepID=UPI0030D419AC